MLNLSLEKVRDFMSFEEFWTRGDIHERVNTALKDAKLLDKKIEIEDLFPLDQYHARGIKATIDLADKVNFKRDSNIIDIGCGLGGPARYFAKKFDCNVYGIDITGAFIDIGNYFNKLTQVDHKVKLLKGDGEKLPYETEFFDGGLSQHVTMNIDNREQFFNEAFRVLKKGAIFGFSEHGLGTKGNPIFPLPWADSENMSFLKTPEFTTNLLKKIGFENIKVISTGEKYISGYDTLLKQGKPDEKPTLGIHVIGGETMLERSKNSMQSIIENRTYPFEIICNK
ncbi:MAG: SAM-dependent methyltransferase [SAR116 cluster bacterium]|nr:SAM-dependent methyltransferase [SAR116 cluster bacterium]RPH11236.1 MAG: SAM-dependent methyltransferase [Alphaproteobacteria bacterium TMED54]